MARGWRLVLAIVVVALTCLAFSGVSTDRQLSAVSKAQSLRGAFQRRVSDDSIYAFDIDGMAQTFRCTFCSFHFRNVAKGEKMTLHVHRQRILAIERDNGEGWSEETAEPRRRRRLATWLGLLGLLGLSVAIWKCRQPGTPS